MPEINIGVIGVSRDYCTTTLPQKRLATLMAELKKHKVNDVVCFHQG